MKIIKVIIAAVFSLAVIGIVLGVVYKIAYENGNVSNEQFDKVVKQTDTGFQYNDSQKDNKVVVRDEVDVYKDMHRMANTKIVADEIWGEDDINEERLNRVILEVMKSNYPDKERLLAILYNWKSKDFNNCVEEHNYVWEKLGGTVGRATSLRK